MLDMMSPYLRDTVPVALCTPHRVAVPQLVGALDLGRHQAVLQAVDAHSVGVVGGLKGGGVPRYISGLKSSRLPLMLTEWGS